MIRKYQEVLKEELYVNAHIIGILINIYDVNIIDYEQQINTNTKNKSLLENFVSLSHNEKVVFECLLEDSILLSMKRIVSEEDANDNNDDENIIDRYSFHLIISNRDIKTSNKNNMIFYCDSKESDNVFLLTKKFISYYDVDYEKYKEHFASLFSYLKYKTFNQK